MAFLTVPWVPTINLANIYLSRPALLQAKVVSGEWGGEGCLWEKGVYWF